MLWLMPEVECSLHITSFRTSSIYYLVFSIEYLAFRSSVFGCSMFNCMDHIIHNVESLVAFLFADWCRIPWSGQCILSGCLPICWLMLEAGRCAIRSVRSMNFLLIHFQKSCDIYQSTLFDMYHSRQQRLIYKYARHSFQTIWRNLAFNTSNNPNNLT